MACVRTGDEVIVFDPAYDSYVPAVTLAGGTARRVPMLLDAANEFSIDWQRLQDTINARTRLIILNYPHNPSGAILDAGDLARLASLLIDREIYIVSDEVYEHIVFDHVPHQSLLRNPELRQRTFVVSSFGKTCHATGWKIGYCVAPAAMTVELRKVHQFNCFSVSTPMQHALAEFTRDKPSHYQLLADFYQKKRDHFIELLSGSGFALTAARSTFFQTADFSAVSDEDDVAFATRLTREIGVASIPVSVFCEQPPSRTLLRFCFAKDDATLEEAAARLCRL
jgi:methionine aminotransferase